MAVVDDAKELKAINDKITDGCAPYWLGMTELYGKIFDLDGKTEVGFSSWDSHLSHGFNTQPDTPYTDKVLKYVAYLIPIFNISKFQMRKF